MQIKELCHLGIFQTCKTKYSGKRFYQYNEDATFDLNFYLYQALKQHGYT